MPFASSPVTVAQSAFLGLPFVLLLGAIAVGPFIDRHWWEHHYAKVSVALGAVVALYYLLALKDYGRLLHVAHEYIGFIALIGSLYVIAGGIHLQIPGRATPCANCLLLLTGAILANLVGTTGASMLLIRPYLRMNRQRIEPFHVVFFIFIVSNVGGCLTPLGDPPLFLGFLKGRAVLVGFPTLLAGVDARSGLPVNNFLFARPPQFPRTS